MKATIYIDAGNGVTTVVEFAEPFEVLITPDYIDELPGESFPYWPLNPSPIGKVTYSIQGFAKASSIREGPTTIEAPGIISRKPRR